MKVTESQIESQIFDVEPKSCFTIRNAALASVGVLAVAGLGTGYYYRDALFKSGDNVPVVKTDKVETKEINKDGSSDDTGMFKPKSTKKSTSETIVETPEQKIVRISNLIEKNEEKISELEEKIDEINCKPYKNMMVLEMKKQLASKNLAKAMKDIESYTLDKESDEYKKLLSSKTKFETDEATSAKQLAELEKSKKNEIDELEKQINKLKSSNEKSKKTLSELQPKKEEPIADSELKTLKTKGLWKKVGDKVVTENKLKKKKVVSISGILSKLVAIKGQIAIPYQVKNDAGVFEDKVETCQNSNEALEALGKFTADGDKFSVDFQKLEESLGNQIFGDRTFSPDSEGKFILPMIDNNNKSFDDVEDLKNAFVEHKKLEEEQSKELVDMAQYDKLYPRKSANSRCIIS